MLQAFENPGGASSEERRLFFSEAHEMWIIYEKIKKVKLSSQTVDMCYGETIEAV